VSSCPRPPTQPIEVMQDYRCRPHSSATSRKYPRASNPCTRLSWVIFTLEVKQCGAKMMADHQKASQEVKQLATKEGAQLPVHMSDKQKQKEQELSKLSGKEFDRAYMQYMLKGPSERSERVRTQRPATARSGCEAMGGGARCVGWC
jgi:hypothetical protein